MAVWLSACQVSTSYYHKQVTIPAASWEEDFQPLFTVHIEDTAAYYQMYFLIRHDDAFPYANLWFRLAVKAPGDSVFRQGPRIEKELADQQGKWLGKGLGDVWEHRIPLSRTEMPPLADTGLYEIRLEQIMRSNPLPSVLQVGLQLEKLDMPGRRNRSGEAGVSKPPSDSVAYPPQR